MVSPKENSSEKSEPPSKRPKLEEQPPTGEEGPKLEEQLPTDEEGPKLEEQPPMDEEADSDDWETLSDDFRLLDEEWGEGFDVDWSKLRHTFGCGAVNLDGDGMGGDMHGSNRDFINSLCMMAITYYKEHEGISLEFVRVLRANYHPSAGITLYITFEANDPSHGNQTKAFQAVVGYFPRVNEVFSCRPRPLD